MALLRFVLVVVCSVVAVHGYGTGAPEQACVDMKPQHVGPPDPTIVTGGNSFSLSFPSQVSAGQTVKIMVHGNNNRKLKGFMLRVAKKGETTPVGHFEPGQTYQVLDCQGGSQNTVTHNDPELKPAVQVNWVAPGPGTYQVKATVVENYDLIHMENVGSIFVV